MKKGKKKKYKGQEGYGYGGITEPLTYIEDRYGGTITPGLSKKISLKSFRCSDFGNENNCTLVAITRILAYYGEKGYSNIPSDYKDIYDKVLNVGRKYGVTEKKGTGPTKINNIINRVLDDFNYAKSFSKAIYFWSLKKQVIREINKDRPVMMNIARGYYGDHTVTVCGYSVYESRHRLPFGLSYTKTHNMICIFDGWSQEYRYIDYEAFSKNLLKAGIGSFNTINMKKPASL